jgi:hypothetical protein
MHNEPDDDQLEEALRRHAARLEPVPASLLQAAQDAFAWRDVDGDLAELVFDSLLDTDDATLVRGSPERRLISFQASGLTIDVEVTIAAAGRAVLGQIMPPRRAAVEIRNPHGAVTVEADELGRFRSGPLRAGPMSLRLSLAADAPGSQVVTDWLAI